MRISRKKNNNFQVLNSLDAKATAVAVRINMVNHQIQVVDNGDGLSKQNLELLGKCYMTNKCHTLSDLHKRSKYYGYRGEAIASICNIANRMVVASRLRNSETTYKRVITERSSKAIQSNPRPSCGSTVTIEGLFQRLPVRQKAIKEDLEFENLKKALESLIIIHHEVSYTLRNDVTGALVVNSHKHPSVTNALRFLHPDLDEGKLKPLKYSRRKFTIEALFYENICHNKKAQYFYVNKRPVVHQEIQKLICSSLLKGIKNKDTKLKKSLAESSKNKHPVYVVNIKCPYSEVDLLLTPSKYQVNFKNMSAVTVCVEKTISSFLGSKTTSNAEPPKDESNKNFPMSICGVSRIAGAVRGNAYRWNDNDNNVTEEQQNLFEDNYVIEDDTRNVIEITQQNPKNHDNIAKRKSNAVNEMNTKRLKIEKKPLPLKLKTVDNKLKKPAEKCKTKSKKRNINSKPKTAAIKYGPVTKAKSITENQKDDDFYKRICSTFKSNLPLQADPDDSVKGKEIIMNKFLKASQVYKNNDYNLDEYSGSNENYFFNLSRTEEFDTYNESLENLASASKLNQKEESTGDLFGPFAAPCNIGNTSGIKTIISGVDLSTERKNSLSYNETNEDCNLEFYNNNDNNNNKSQQFSIEAFRQSLTQKSKSDHTEDSTFIRSSNNVYKSKGIQTSFFTVKNKDPKQRKHENKTSKCIQTTIVEHIKSPPYFELSQNDGTRKTQNYENFNLKNNFRDVNSHRIKNKNNVSDDIKLPRSIIPKQHEVEEEPYHQKFEQRIDSIENQYIVNEDMNSPYKICLGENKVDHVPYHQNFQQNFNEELKPFETNWLQEDKVISLDYGNKISPPSKNISFFPNKFEYVQMKGHIENQIERKSMKNYVSNYDYNFAHINEIPQIHPENEDNNPYYFCLKDMTVKLFDCHERKFQKLQSPRRDPWGTHFQPPEIKSMNHPNLYYNEFPQQIIQHDYNFRPLVDKQFNFLSNDLNLKSPQNRKFERNIEASVDHIELSPINKVSINNVRDIKPSHLEFPENYRINKLSLKKTAEDNEKATIKELQNHPLYTESNAKGRCPGFSLRNINDEVYQKSNLSLADLASIKMIPTERKYRKKITDLDTSRFFAASSVNTSHYFAPLKDTFDLNKKKLGPLKDHIKKKNVELNISLLDISSKIKNDTTSNHEVSLEIGPSFGNFNPPFKSTQNFITPKTTLKLSGLSQNQKNQNKPLFGTNYSDAPRMKSPMNSTFPRFDLNYGVENVDNQNASGITFAIHNDCNEKTKNTEIFFSKQNQDESGDEEDSAEIIDASIDFEDNVRKKNTVLQKKLPFRFDNRIPVNMNVSPQGKKNTCMETKYQETIVTDQRKCSISGSPVKSQAKNHSHESEHEWMKILDQFGTTFYFNKRTGMTTFYSPKSEENFGLALRSEFVPKGLSPILIESKKVEKTLSACEKQKLQEAIMKSYQDELLIIKWENFVDLQDPGKFFSQLYREKSNKFRSSIPSAKSSYKNAKAISFNKSLFKDVSIIGQLDMKFIVTVTKSTHHLILFDQHAVHERIRLEDLHDEYNHSSHKMKNTVTIFFPQNDLHLILNHRSYLDKLGFIFEEITNGIKISSIPLCLWKKIFKESEENLNYLSEVIEILMNQILEMIKSKSALVHAPPLLENIISMEACRGAFKFGQVLTKDVCSKLIHDLQKCNLPFQCAHGRPTLTPLFTFQTYQKPSKFFSRVKFENLSLVK